MRFCKVIQDHKLFLWRKNLLEGTKPGGEGNVIVLLIFWKRQYTRYGKKISGKGSWKFYLRFQEMTTTIPLDNFVTSKYWVTQKKVIIARKKFRNHHDLHNMKCFSHQKIRVTKFDQTDSALNKPTPGRPRSSRTDWNVDSVLSQDSWPFLS